MLFLSGDDVAGLLPMADALEAVEDAFRAESEGRAQSIPRMRAKAEGAMLHVLPGAYGDVLGLKAYATTRRGASFVVILFDRESSKPLCLIEADRLGQIRTGAASGVATKHMAREEAHVLGIIGTGWQARAQVEAICAVRPIKSVRAFSRDIAHREAFAREMTEKAGVPVRAVDSAEAAVRGADVVVTVTTSKTPVLEGAWLAPGVHVNACGSNAASRRELDADAVLKADRIATDNLEQAKVECGDLIPVLGSWDAVLPLSAIVAGKAIARIHDGQITLYESHGIATQDLAVAALVYRRAMERGIGNALPWE